MLEIDSVSLCYGNRDVLSGCYICCKPGEVLGLLGRNGCGKSSLLKIIFGTLEAGYRHLRIDDKFFTVGQVLNDCDPSIVSDDINRLFSGVIGKRISRLSGGELRFLECLWILSRAATYLLLDEPFSEIAPFQIEILQDIIKKKGKTKGIILTDHFYLPLMEVSTRIVLMHNNAIYTIGDESDLILYNYIPNIQ